MDNILKALYYYQNGYLPIPANATEKIPLVRWSELNRESYRFHDVWNGQPGDVDTAIILDSVVCVDFDCHGPAPNGRTVYDLLVHDHPAMMGISGCYGPGLHCVTETTQSGGVHVYYKAPQGLDREFIAEIFTVPVEIKTGRRLAYCAPSRKNGMPAYEIKGLGFDTIKAADLSPLPQYFLDHRRKQREAIEQCVPTATRRFDGDFSLDVFKDRASLESWVVERIARRYVGARDGDRHNAGVRMVSWLRHLGADQLLVDLAVDYYGRRMGRKPNPGELEGLRRWG